MAIQCSSCGYWMDDASARSCDECGELFSRATVADAREREPAREAARTVPPNEAPDLSRDPVRDVLSDAARDVEENLKAAGEAARQNLKDSAPRFDASSSARHAKPDVSKKTVVHIGRGWQTDPFDLAVDVLRPYVAADSGHTTVTLRLCVAANAYALMSTRLKIDPHTGLCQRREADLSNIAAGSSREHIFTIENLSEGQTGCEVFLTFVHDGIVSEYRGVLEINVIKRDDLRDVVNHNINLHYNPHLEVGDIAQAAELRLASHGFESMFSKDQDAVNPMSVIDAMARSGSRTYRKVDMQLIYGDFLGSPPESAKAKEIEICLAGRFVQFFVDDLICIGHSICDYRYSDIVIDAPAECKPESRGVYDKISRIHCTLQYDGHGVCLCDGRLEPNGMMVPSTNGTLVDGGKLSSGWHRLDKEGVVQLGDSENAVKLNFSQITSKKCETRCKAVHRERCAGGSRPCVLFERGDVFNRFYVALWSCFDLEKINWRYKGVDVFYHQGAFGWHYQGQAGWFEKGKKTDFGLSQGAEITVSEVW